MTANSKRFPAEVVRRDGDWWVVTVRDLPLNKEHLSPLYLRTWQFEVGIDASPVVGLQGLAEYRRGFGEGLWYFVTGEPRV